MRAFRTRAIAIVSGACILGVVACGDDEPAGTTTAPPETTASAAKPVDTVEVSETEYKLDPADPQVSKSGVVEIRVGNNGGVDHSLEVEGPDGEAETPTLPPGDSASLKVDLPAGEYTWYCPIANHRELGMEGTITVEGGSGGSGGSGDSRSKESRRGSGDSRESGSKEPRAAGSKKTSGSGSKDPQARARQGISGY